MITMTEPTASTNGITFLYPTSRKYPFDKVCDLVVRELEKRNWQVPGISVQFDVYGTGAEKYRLVRTIEGKDFKLYFCRVQRTMPGGHWNDTAAVTTLNIPWKELHVYEDESGPTFYLYVGKNWERDREKFVKSGKVHAKFNGEPRTYLEYEGGCDCGATGGASFEGVNLITALVTGDTQKLADLKHTHRGLRSPLLVHTNDLGRQYDPERGNWNWKDWRREPGDPICFKTAEVFAEFETWIRENVLAYIMSFEVPEEKVECFKPDELIPFPAISILGELFCFADWRDADRIRQGKVDETKLAPTDRYGMLGLGYRLASLDIRNDGTVPEIAYDGFLWCGIESGLVVVPLESLEIPGHSGRSNDSHVLRVQPKSANDIYIADHGPYEKRRKELGDVMEKGRDRYTDKEVLDFTRARARTIIPIADYKGGFEKPIVLIKRELSFDEVEVLGEIPRRYI